MEHALYVVATPIGNPDDITLRAINVLKNVDVVICEEYKNGSRLLKRYQISNKLLELNEHNEKTETDYILKEILMRGKSAALISDAGSPLFADPGSKLVEMCNYYQIKVKPVPGASSLMAALMGAGEIKKFAFYGFLPANKTKRKSAIAKLPRDIDIVLLETPYRLKQLLKDLSKILGEKKNAIIAYKLTMPEEKFIFGTLKELSEMDIPKGEFVLIIKNV